MDVRPLLLGHRGTRRHKSIPENTLEAFDFALASGCDGFEFDVRLSADGKAVICHDEATPALDLEIVHCAGEELDLPLLRKVLSRYCGKAFLDIELKVAGVERITADLLRESKVDRDSLVVSSFLPGVLESLHRVDAKVPLGLICETQTQLRRWLKLPIEYVIPHYKLVRRELISELKSAGKKIIVWTVNTPAAMKRFAKSGVDGIVSDNPQQLFHILREQPIEKNN
jgi:glycerophosphoryl diester phosphodiesterase